MAARRARWRLRCGVRIGYDPVRGQDVLFHPEGVLLLNESASAVLALCDGDHDTAGITAALNRSYAEASRDEIESFLIALADRHLVQPAPAPEPEPEPAPEPAPVAIGPSPAGRRHRDG